MDCNMPVCFTKNLDLIAFMPSRTVYPQVDDFIFESMCNICKEGKKTSCIACVALHHAVQTIYRVNPTHNIQTLLMLAGRTNNPLFPFFRPHSSKLWMQGKTCLISKKNHSIFYPVLDHLKFFLTKREILLLPSSMPEQNDTRAASGYTPIHAATAESAAPESLRRELVSNILQQQYRPNAHVQCLNLLVASQVLTRVRAYMHRLSLTVFLVDACHKHWMTHLYWLSKSILQHSTLTIQIEKLCRLISTPIKATEVPQCESQSTHLVYAISRRRCLVICVFVIFNAFICILPINYSNNRD